MKNIKCTLTPIVSVFMAILISSFSACAEHPPAVEIDGELKNCDGLNDFLDVLAKHDDTAFTEWKKHDFEKKRTWLHFCLNTYQFENAKPFIDQFDLIMAETFIRRSEGPRGYQFVEAPEAKIEREKQHEESLADIALRNKEQADRENSEREALVEQQRLKKEAKDARERKISECHESKRYRLYEAQERVTSDLDQIAQLNYQMARERKIAAASGVRDLRAERAYGEWVTDWRDTLSEDFKAYKELGGKAGSPSKIKAPNPDPCAALVTN